MRISQNIYLGRKKNMLISNSLFRVGGAAIMLSNRSSDYLNGSAQMELVWTSRTHMGRDATSYTSVWQDEDEAGFKGVSIDKKLTEVAGKALQVHLTSVAPWLLTWKEIFLTLLFMMLRVVARCIRIGYWKIQGIISKKQAQPPLATPRTMTSPLHSEGKTPTNKAENKQADASSIRRLLNYMPSFHNPQTKICVHAGGRAILDGIQKALKLPDEDLAAGRFVLHEFGNVSSASVWYELEAMHKLVDESDTSLGKLVSEFCVQKASKGSFIWQLAFGSGFKVNSAMWKVLR
jgi:3-ketoacyl-CoA synthase